MVRYVAFLRGINVGGHVVKMDQLRRHFEGLGLGTVSTFIASGNVIFQSGQTGEADAPALERRIENGLREALGYDVATFLRTDAEVAKVAAHVPFPDVPAMESDTNYVIFLKETPEAAASARVLALANDQDLLHVHGQELYWLRRGSILDSTIDLTDFSKVLGGMATTSRNVNTVRRLAAKYPPTASEPPA